MGPSKGYLITGRSLNSNEIGNIAKIINVDFTTLSEQSISRNLSETKSELLMNNNIVISALSTKAVAGYVLRRDIYGDAAFIIKVPMERIIMFQGRTSIKYQAFLNQLIVCL